MCIQSTPMLKMSKSTISLTVSTLSNTGKAGNTKRIIEVEQAFLIYSNALQKKRRRVRVLILWQYPHWVIRERRGKTKRGHVKSCSIYSNALKRVWVSKRPFQRYPRWVISERRGNTRIRKKAHKKDCFDT